jgi:hypothetical protein
VWAALVAVVIGVLASGSFCFAMGFAVIKLGIVG